MDREHTRYFEYDEQEAEVEEPGDSVKRVSFEEEEDVDEWVVPGVPIVRSSTPRPQSFSMALLVSGAVPVVQQHGQDGIGQSMFPVEAPVAPPLPEEDVELGNGSPGTEGDGDREETVETVGATPLPLSGQGEPLEDSGFVWLFEYGLEMDGMLLNSPKRLDGVALLYGPAVLKGYELTFDVLRSRAGEVVATILPSRLRGAEVWGVLYRVPHRVVERQGEEPALLDEVHAAAPPDGLFERLQVVVHEAYRARELLCVTYIASATARNHFHLLPRDKQIAEPTYVERLLACAKKQKLPGSYLDELTALVAAEVSEVSEHLVDVPKRESLEQNTEPLPVVIQDAATPGTVRPEETREIHKQPEKEQKGSAKRPPVSRGLLVFAIYLVVVLLAVFVLAVLQGLGFGDEYLTPSFLLLGVPWFVLLYGLVGGCLSSIIALGRRQVLIPPNFVLITWFSRPFVGALLAAVAYLLLNSGLFVFSGSVAQHALLYSVIAVAAGAGEGRLFLRKR